MGGAYSHFKAFGLSPFPASRECCTEGLLSRHALDMLGRTLHNICVPFSPGYGIQTQACIVVTDRYCMHGLIDGYMNTLLKERTNNKTLIEHSIRY